MRGERTILSLSLSKKISLILSLSHSLSLILSLSHSLSPFTSLRQKDAHEPTKEKTIAKNSQTEAKFLLNLYFSFSLYLVFNLLFKKAMNYDIKMLKYFESHFVTNHPIYPKFSSFVVS